MTLCVRQILFKCHRFHLEHFPEKKPQVMDLKLIVAGLRVSGMESANETDALNSVRAAIQKDMVCGYIAVQRKLLVLAKNNPFPKLRNINLEAGEIFVEAE